MKVPVHSCICTWEQPMCSVKLERIPALSVKLLAKVVAAVHLAPGMAATQPKVLLSLMV